MVKIVYSLRAAIALISMVMGLLKIYTHYYSIFRYGPLDYIVSIGAIMGGLLVLTKKTSDIISFVCIGFIAFEIFKALIDYRDFNDVLLCTIAIICLIMPLSEFGRKKV